VCIELGGGQDHAFQVLRLATVHSGRCIVVWALVDSFVKSGRSNVQNVTFYT
jgi:hypothetical protein